MRTGKIFGIVACLALTGVSSVFFAEEYQAFRLSRETDRGQYEHLALGETTIAGSVRGRYAVLRACDEGQRSLFAEVQSTPSRRMVAAECLSLARQALAQAPTLSLAHYVVARSHLHLGDFDAFNRALGLSQRMGATEGWIAQRRFDLAVGANEHLDESGRRTLGRDTGLLLRSIDGVDLVADRYVQFETAREAILREAENLSAGDQRRFLSRVRDAQQGLGGE